MTDDFVTVTANGREISFPRETLENVVKNAIDSGFITFARPKPEPEIVPIADVETAARKVSVFHRDAGIGMFIQPSNDDLGCGAFMSREDAAFFARAILDELEAGAAAEPEPTPAYGTTIGADGSFVITTPDRTYVIAGPTLAEFVDDMMNDEADVLEDAGFDDVAFERALVNDLSKSLDLNKREREHFRSMVAASLDRVSCGETVH